MISDSESPDFRWKICGYCNTAYMTAEEVIECIKVCLAPTCPKCKSNLLMYGLQDQETGLRPARCTLCDHEWDIPNDTPFIFDEESYMISRDE